MSDILNVLRARVERRTRLEAAGRWALSFPTADRLKFVAVLRGDLCLTTPCDPPRLIEAGDVCLLGATGYVVGSDPDVSAIDGEPLYADHDVAQLGGDDTVAIGGVVTFRGGGGDFLLDMLPACMAVSGCSPAADAVAAILSLLGAEFDHAEMGGQIVSARLADVLLVQAIRAYARSRAAKDIGWLAALSDRRIGRVLRAIHDDVAHPWTLAAFAGLAGMSRSAFAAEFNRLVGKPPLGYLRAWRLTLARTALDEGQCTVGAVAAKFGYTSQSAFGHAFRRAYGKSPTARALARSNYAS